MADFDEKKIQKYHQQKRHTFIQRNQSQWKRPEQKSGQCKKPGHIARDCRTPPVKVQARVYTMTKEQADADASVRRLGIIPDMLDVMYNVMTPSGEEINSNQMLKHCSIQMSGRTLYADLVCLLVANSDTILGMDWLTKYYATINCNQKVVIFQPPGEEHFEFGSHSLSSSIPFIATLKAQKMMSKGCVGYLANYGHFSRNTIETP
ncbi:PREDICTED: uncharacterized protein LOC105977337 [Erythranthe guttata]|uniref:uncharacterized protein LOC105977337 n=1 Tax=Erythranthe guttata TaxID=4155 RepID=UPI00064DF9CA|nr:PREDICTED: uncharacterized protein LOC105977337 [Erythranthe guttata]|eukprot:XP_012858095.1 PREDICTED: uncharacterized protein LOC105977337 [Erythranthe guttata]